MIKDWDGMELIWNHAICNELESSPYESSVLLTEPVFNHKEFREKMA